MAWHGQLQAVARCSTTLLDENDNVYDFLFFKKNGEKKGKYIFTRESVDFFTILASPLQI
jgi:hypothetical protein